jgi:3-carboxy-cis,cis-muconate cycloisomerase
VADGWSDGMLESGLGDREVAELVGWPARVARMVQVEAALARALARAGLLDAPIADAVVAACSMERVDLEVLAERAESAATPVIPLLDMLRNGLDAPTAEAVHLGATSQDVIDTAMVLQARGALARIEALLVEVGDRCAELAEEHRPTVMAGRTLGQQAVPVTFGLKAARWAAAVGRRLERLRPARDGFLVVQLGGAAGTLGAYGDRGQDVVEALAEDLGLGVPDVPWHAERDRVVDLVTALLGAVTTAGKIANDCVLLAQTEIGEVRERGTSPPPPRCPTSATRRTRSRPGPPPGWPSPS